jgi:hypothetical protein
MLTPAVPPEPELAGSEPSEPLHPATAAMAVITAMERGSACLQLTNDSRVFGGMGCFGGQWLLKHSSVGFAPTLRRQNWVKNAQES